MGETKLQLAQLKMQNENFEDRIDELQAKSKVLILFLYNLTNRNQMNCLSPRIRK
jgi:hypothetical protein